MKTELYIFFFVGSTLAAPASGWVDPNHPLKHWPEVCDSKKYHAKGENTVWEKDDLVRPFMVLGASQYDKYVNGASSNRGKSFPDFVAQALDFNYNWQCDTSKCTIGDGIADKCKKSQFAGSAYLFLDSAWGYWKYIESLKFAIDDARSYISGQLPKMSETFESKGANKAAFKDSLSMVTSGATMFGSFLPGVGAAATSFGTAAINGLAPYIIPEESSEKKFEDFSQFSQIFSDNVDILTNAINKFILKEYTQKLDYESKDVSSMQDAIMGDPLYKVISTGDFAGLSPPTIQLKDRGVRAALAAPLINAMWRRSRNFVVKFEGPAWKEQKIDVCGEDVFPDLRQKGEDRLGCDQPDKSLYMIAHDEMTGYKNLDKSFRNVKGIDRLEAFSISRRDIVTGSERNHNAGGFSYVPKTQELFDRVTKADSREQALNGHASIWNLPFCIVKPSKPFYKQATLEETLARAALSCGSIKGWPYK